MTEVLILTVLTVLTCTFAGFLHGYKKGYGQGKRAGYFRAHQEVNR